MPIYEYRCRDCERQFEKLVRSTTTVACPSCQGGSLELQFSVFAVGNGGTSTATRASGPCGSCGDPRGPGACSLD